MQENSVREDAAPMQCARQVAPMASDAAVNPDSLATIVTVILQEMSILIVNLDRPLSAI